MAIAHSDFRLASGSNAKPRAAKSRATKPAPAARTATAAPVIPADDFIVMPSVLRLDGARSAKRGKRSLAQQTALYAVPIALVLGAATWFALGSGSGTSQAPDTPLTAASTPAATAAPMAATPPAPAPTASARASAPVRRSAPQAAAAPASTPIAAEAAPAPQASASVESNAVNASATEPLPPAQLAASVDSAPAELAPVPAASPVTPLPEAVPQ